MKRDEWIEKLKEARDPVERAKILDILSSLEKDGVPSGGIPSGGPPAGMTAVSGVFLGYLVGGLFLAGGAWMIYNGFIAVAGGMGRGRVLTFLVAGSLLVILGILALFRAGRIRGVAKEPPPDAHRQDSDGFRPGP